jgi:hypothetical protein
VRLVYLAFRQRLSARTIHARLLPRKPGVGLVDDHGPVHQPHRAALMEPVNLRGLPRMHGPRQVPEVILLPGDHLQLLAGIQGDFCGPPEALGALLLRARRSGSDERYESEFHAHDLFSPSQLM